MNCGLSCKTTVQNYERRADDGKGVDVASNGKGAFLSDGPKDAEVRLPDGPYPGIQRLVVC